MISVFQEIDAATNLYEKGKRFLDKKYLYRKYKDFPYFFINYNKKTYINKNGDGIVFMSCDMMVLDKAKTKYIKAKLDITDAKAESNFPTFHQMQLLNKEPFKDCYFKVWANDGIITSVTEDYYVLPERDRSEWKRSNKKIALRINLNSNILEEKKAYKISYMFSVPGMFPIFNGYYDEKSAQISDSEEMVSSLDIEEYCDKCKYSIYVSEDIKVKEKISGFANKSGIDDSVDISAYQQHFGFYNKNIMNVKQAKKYRSIGFKWQVQKLATEAKGDINNGEIVTVLNEK